MLGIGGFKGWVKGALGGPFWFLLALSIASGFGVYWFEGSAGLNVALAGESEMLVGVVPRIVAAMLIAGLVQVLLPRDHVVRWIGARSGTRGLIIAAAAGAITPGGPMTSFPVVAALYGAGADRGALVAYVTSWSLLGLHRVLVWEAPFLGKDFVLTRLAASLVLPIIAGWLARRLPLAIDPPATEGRP